MPPLQKTIKAFIQKGDQHYVAECLEIAVVTQGKSLDEVISNLKEAVALHLEGENLEEFGLAPDPTLVLEFVMGTNTLHHSVFTQLVRRRNGTFPLIDLIAL